MSTNLLRLYHGGESNPAAKLTNADARAIRVQKEAGARTKTLAVMYDVSAWAIRNVVSRRSFKDVR